MTHCDRLFYLTKEKKEVLMCYLLDEDIALISTRAGLQTPWPTGPKAGPPPTAPPLQSDLPQTGKVSDEQTTFFILQACPQMRVRELVWGLQIDFSR